jgi:hypothetical protein
VDDGNTVLYGSYSNGIKFARPNPQGGADQSSLNTSLFNASGTNTSYDSKPIRILTGNNGRVYGVFEDWPNRKDSQGNNINLKVISVYQILPHDTVPKLEMEIPGNQPAWSWLDKTLFQIADDFIYYKDSESVDKFGSADVIKLQSLIDRGTVHTILKGTEEARYQIYNWKLKNKTIYFSALNKAKNKVVTGEIDTSKIINGNLDEALITQESISAISSELKIDDIEIIELKQADIDDGKAPEIIKVYQDNENLYSMSVDFSKKMDHQSVDLGLTIKSSANEGQNDGVIPALKLWINKTLHLIPDMNGLGDDTTLPLTKENTYTLGFAKDSIKDAFNHSEFLPYSEHSIKMRPANGFYIGSINEILPKAIASGKILSYAVNVNEEKEWKTFGLAEVPANVRIEFSAKNHFWSGFEMAYHHDDLNKFMAEINMGHTTSVNYQSSDPDINYIVYDNAFTPQILDGTWKRYRIDFYANNIKIYYSRNGIEFTEVKPISKSDFASRTTDGKYRLLLKVKESIAFDNLKIIALDESGMIIEPNEEDSSDEIILNEDYNDAVVDPRYKTDITK